MGRRSGLPSAGGRCRVIVALSMLAVVLGGCGFHLRGASPLPDGINAMSVSYSNDYRVATPPLVTELRQRLRERGRLGGVDAPAQLDIDTIENSRHVVAVSPVDSRVATFALTTRVVFDYRINGKTRLSHESLVITRDYSVNDTRRLAAESQRRDLLTDMHRRLADRIFTRIADVSHRLIKPRDDSTQGS